MPDSLHSDLEHIPCNVRIWNIYPVMYVFVVLQNGAFENAVESCRAEVMKNDLDGELRGAWLLCE